MNKNNFIIAKLKDRFPSIYYKLIAHDPINREELILISDILLDYSDDKFLRNFASNFGIKLFTETDKEKSQEDKEYSNKVTEVQIKIISELNSSNESILTNNNFDTITNLLLKIKFNKIKEINPNLIDLSIFGPEFINQLLKANLFPNNMKNFEDFTKFLDLNPITFNKISDFKNFTTDFKDTVRDFIFFIISENRISLIYPLTMKGYSRILPIFISDDKKFIFNVLDKSVFFELNKPGIKYYKMKI